MILSTCSMTLCNSGEASDVIEPNGHHHHHHPSHILSNTGKYKLSNHHQLSTNTRGSKSSNNVADLILSHSQSSRTISEILNPVYPSNSKSSFGPAITINMPRDTHQTHPQQLPLP